MSEQNSIFEYGNWEISFKNGGISNSEEIENIKKLKNLSNIPDMFFGSNYLNIKLKDTDHLINFCVNDCFDFMSIENSKNIKVAVSKDWIKSIEHDNYSIRETYDWTYTTLYKGTLNGIKIEPSKYSIDINKLLEPKPIIVFKEIDLFEDELADNGSSSLKLRIRVVEAYCYVLLRFLLRVDAVIYRVIDTRLYFEKNWNYMYREIIFRESLSEQLKFPSKDEQTFVNQVKIISQKMEKLSFD